MDVRLSDEQELLRGSVREFLERECPLARTREIAEGDLPFPADLWKAMAQLGWMGLALPEACGGAGLGPIEQAVVLEEMGRVLLPGPYFATVVLAAGAIAEGGSEEQQRRLLPSIARGERAASLALLEAGGRWDAAGVQLEARAAGSGFRLTGAKRFVPEADAAGLLLVAARTGGAGEAGVTLFCVDPEAPGVTRRRIAFGDLTRRVHEVRFDGVALGREAVLGGVGGAWPVLERLLDRARVALAAEMTGAASRVLEMSVSFARTREQFGRPIGSFQAIQHKCADMLLQLEGARSATWYAAWTLAEGEPDAHLAACMAKAWCSEAFARVAGDGIQIHGGLGFTWEQDPQLYYKRAKASELFLGDAPWHRQLIARALWPTS